MPQVSRPRVPDGPIFVFFDRLHALHGAAGQPAMRQLQRRTRSPNRPNGIDHTTIHKAFTQPNVARWEVVREVVRALGGDLDEFTTLWHAARRAELSTRTDDRPPAGTAPGVAAQPPHGDAGMLVPRELPPDVFAFTGRSTALATMDNLLAGADNERAALVVAVVSGTAGVGKTAVAVHWAHQVAGYFPDGQLYVDLRGYDPDQPVDPAQVLARFLRAVGVPGVDIPYELAERASRYRSLLARRRMLVILDNAGTTEQVRDLLPGTPSCLVVVTSRDSLAGLVARHGARRVDLDLLTAADAEALLGTLIGPRADTDPGATARLARLCTGLPLALRIAAEVAVDRQHVPLAELVDEFSDDRHRLDLLDVGADQHTGIRAVFSWSYRRLPPDAARMFRLFGTIPSADLDTAAAAALIGADLSQTWRTLDALGRANLVQRTAAGRFSMHDLLRSYADQLATQIDSDADRRQALTRVFDHYLSTAGQAMDIAFPAERGSRPSLPTPPTSTGPIHTQTQAQQWLDAERAGLVASVVHAADHDWPAHAMNLAATLWRYLHNGAHHSDAIAVHRAALAASRRLNHRTGEGTALTNLGTVYWRWGGYDLAIDSYQQALAAFTEAGDQGGLARVLTNLGAVYWRRSRYDRAAASLEQAVAAFAGIGDRRGQARALDNLGAVHLRQGRYELADAYHQQALAMLRDIGDHAGEARALDNLGLVYRRQGCYGQAATHHRQALAVFTSIRDSSGEALALHNLGTVHREEGRTAQAVADHERSLEIAAGSGNRSREVSALNALGESLRADGRPVEALRRHRAAQATAEDLGDRYEQARALDGIAHAHSVLGDLRRAQQHWREALVICLQIGVPEADDIHAALTPATADDQVTAGVPDP